MSTRQGWKIAGQHFTKTTTERGGTRHFIDGTPYRRDEWLEHIEAAQRADPSLGGRIKIDPAA
jgi:hypothetical protein